MNNYNLLVKTDEREWTVELSFVTLLFYDTIHADLSRLCGNFTAFWYEDEDGDAITVRTDADVEGFREALQFGSISTIFLIKPEVDTSEVALILPSDLQHLDVISSGQFGTVYRSLHLPSDEVVAVKCIEMPEDGNEQTDIVSEIKILKQCESSEFVVGLRGASLDSNIFLICLEYMDGGSISSYAPIPSEILPHVAFSIFEGLKCIWRLKIMHRDLKPENVLINSRGFTKLSDFGVSKRMDMSIARSFVGTSAYMAPERCRGGEYRLESDIWSFGLTIWELFHGSFPVDPGQNLLDWQHFLTAQRAALSAGVETHLAEFIHNCVCPDVTKRWGLAELEHSYYLQQPLDRLLIARLCSIQ